MVFDPLAPAAGFAEGKSPTLTTPLPSASGTDGSSPALSATWSRSSALSHRMPVSRMATGTLGEPAVRFHAASIEMPERIGCPNLGPCGSLWRVVVVVLDGAKPHSC